MPTSAAHATCKEAYAKHRLPFFSRFGIRTGFWGSQPRALARVVWVSSR